MLGAIALTRMPNSPAAPETSCPIPAFVDAYTPSPVSARARGGPASRTPTIHAQTELERDRRRRDAQDRRLFVPRRADERDRCRRDDRRCQQNEPLDQHGQHVLHPCRQEIRQRANREVVQTPIRDDAADEGQHRERELRDLTGPQKAGRGKRASRDVDEDDRQLAAQRNNQDGGCKRIDRAQREGAVAALDTWFRDQRGENFVDLRILFS